MKAFHLSPLRILGTFLASSLILSASQAAYAADPQKCQQYAQTAVEQYQQNVSMNCNFSGPRWQSNYQNHYKWCLGVPVIFVDFETQARANELIQCSKTRVMKPLPLDRLIPIDPIPIPEAGDLQTTQQACDNYAKAAVAQYNENVRLGCGFSGQYWGSDHEAHYNWCLQTNAKEASKQNKSRQAQLKNCQQDKSCVEYAKSAVDQQKQNLAQNCGYAGPMWNANFNYHYNWCRKGDNVVFAAQGTQARSKQLALCAANRPLDGDFTIKKVVSRYTANKVVDRIEITIETTSSQAWKIGNYGHPQYGSLWAEVTAINKVWSNGLVQDQKRNYFFAIRGIASGKQAFATPHPGTQVAAGKQTVMLTVVPFPRIQHVGVQRIFGVPTGAPFSPGKLGCWHDFPRVDVKVSIVTAGNVVKTRTATTGDITQAFLEPVGIPAQGGFGQGVIYQKCFPPNPPPK